MDLDQVIAEMEEDLAALRRARDLARQYGVNGATTPAKLHNGKSNAPWFSLLPDMLRNEAMSVREIERALKAKGFTTAYSSVHTWIGRALKRGEYVRRGSKYKFKGASANGADKEATT